MYYTKQHGGVGKCIELSELNEEQIKHLYGEFVEEGDMEL
jgi:hypothetical protein